MASRSRTTRSGLYRSYLENETRYVPIEGIAMDGGGSCSRTGSQVN